MLSRRSNQLFFLSVLCIFVSSFFIRVFAVESYPPILNRDEAALAYNAYLIKKSGVDEWSRPYPVQFESFGDYKIGGYIYVLLGFFTLFGYSDFIVRLPAVIAGSMLVLLSTLFFAEVLPVPKQQKKVFTLILCLFLSVTPFSFFYSRMAWEATLSLSLMMLALYLFFQTERKQDLKTDLTAAVFYFLACLTYNTALLLTPGFIFALALFRYQRKKTFLRPVLLLTTVFLISLLLLLSVAARKSSITIFSDPLIESQYPDFRFQFTPELQSILGNKFNYYLWLIFQRFLQTFSLDFLVTSGGTHPWHSILGQGHLFFFQVILMYIGTLILILQSALTHFNRDPNQKNLFNSLLSLFLLLFSVLPAAITVDAPHATRSLFALYFMVAISAYCVVSLLQFFKNFRNLQFFFLGFLTILLSFESSRYLHRYFILWPTDYPPDFHLGVVQVAQQASSLYPNKTIAIVDNTNSLYILMAWYDRVEPDAFFSTLKRSGKDTVGLSYGEYLTKYRFIQWDSWRKPDEILLTSKDGKWQIQE